jgi:hypothetical protein
MKSKIKQIVLISLISAFYFFNFAQAYLIQCGTSESKRAQCGIGDLLDTVFTVVNFLLGSATLLAIGYVLYGGVRMVTAFGNEEAIKSAKATIRNAIVGLIMIILSYLIITSVTSYFTGIPFNKMRTCFLNADTCVN